LPKAFDLKLREIKLQYGLGSMEDEMEDRMVVSQEENRAESGEVERLQGEGERLALWQQNLDCPFLDQWISGVVS